MSTALARDAELLRSLVHRIDPKDPGASNNLGVLYHTKGLHAEAVDAFLHALALDPRMQTAARNLEIAAAVPGACDARLAALAARIAADPDDLAARTGEARLLRNMGRLDEAVRLLDALIAEYPEDASALLERGLLERRTGDLRRAQRWLERACNNAPHEPVARLFLAEVLYNRGNSEQALTILDALLLDEPALADAHLLRSFALGDLGRHQAASAAAQQATALNPALSAMQSNLSLDAGSAPTRVAVGEGDELAHYGLGLAFRQRGYFEGAYRELLRARELGEDHRLVEHALAEIDLVTGQAARAAESYRQLIARYGPTASFWCEHGVALHQLGRVEEAADSYRRALREDPRHALSYNNLGVALEHAGDAPAAREAFLRATELEATLVLARLNLARWLVRHQDALGALALLRELAAFQPNDADAWFELGRVLLVLERHGEARQSLARAIELNAAHAGARYALADALAALGDDEGAARETQHALALAPMRGESRLALGIDLQRECPEAVTGLDLLTLAAVEPLAGTVLSTEEVSGWLPEPSDVAAASDVTALSPLERARAECQAGDEFAARGLHGEAQERYARAWEWLSDEDGDEAAADSDADSSDCAELRRHARLGDARSLCLLGRGHEALDALRALDAIGDNVEVLALLSASEAQFALRSGADRARACHAMTRLLRLSPEGAGLLHFAGDTAQSLGEHEYAMFFYRRALAADPSRPTPRVAIARMLRRRGDTLAAQLELVAALATLPGMRDARLELSRVHLVRHRTAEALTVLRALLEEDPTDVESLVLLGEALADAERYADARVALGHAMRYDPDHPRALFVEGTVLAAQGRLREARDRWHHLVSTGADSPEVAHARTALARVAAEWSAEGMTTPSRQQAAVA